MNGIAAPAGSSDRLIAFLAETDAPCPGCGYNLRALMSARCPECGAELRLQVGLVEPRLGAFICGALAVGAGLGFNGLLVGYFIARNLGRRGGLPAHEAISLFISLAAFVVIGWVWLRTRRRQRGWPPVAHWFIAAGIWVLTVGSALWFFGTVR